MPKMYSDIEVTAKVCMDPESMYNVMKDLERGASDSSNILQLISEMKSVLIRLAEMHCLPCDMAEDIMRC